MKDASKSRTTSPFVPLGLGLLLPVMVTSCESCKKPDDPPPPLPATASVPATTAEPVVLKPEDAGTDAHDAGTDAKKPTATGPRPAGGLKKCCQAIKQNAANAPPPTKAILENLAASCFAMAGQGASSFPQGAAYSPACK
jgi:hypothetical protein